MHLRERGNTPEVLINADQIAALETTDAMVQGKGLGFIFSDSEPEISAAGVVIDDRFLGLLEREQDRKTPLVLRIKQMIHHRPSRHSGLPQPRGKRVNHLIGSEH